MKKVLFIISLFAFISIVNAQDLERFEKDGKFGIMDESGNVILSAEFDWIPEHNIKHIMVFKGTTNRYGSPKKGFRGLYNIKGEILIPVEYGHLSFNSNKPDDFVLIKVFKGPTNEAGKPKKGKWGVYNLNGEIIVPFHDFLDFDNNDKEMIRVFDGQLSDSGGPQKGACGFYNHLGEIIIPLNYDSHGIFKNGVIEMKKDGNYYYFNKKGDEVAKPE